MAAFLKVIGTLLTMFSTQKCTEIWNQINLPEEHIPYFFTNNQHIEELCITDEKCPYKEYVNTSRCWGYERNCPIEQRMGMPKCPGDCPKAWAPTKEKQIEKFWSEGDFGYIKDRLSEKTIICEPEAPGDSSLECVSYLRYCQARNLYMDFTHVDFDSSTDRYREDVFKKGHIGGKCKFHKQILKMQGDHKSPLQSWFAEFQEYSSIEENSIICDLTYDKPVVLIKLDAGVNMFHHFCDFINLYASQHLNNSFSQDITVVMWDTSPYNYGDFFHDTWKVFTNYPIVHLKEFVGKRLCFKDAVFPLLARMRYGMYYNMPLIPGCEGSSLFRAFSQHVMHRLNIPQEGPLEKKVRVTLLARSTQYRRIINQNEIISALKIRGDIDFKVVDFNKDIPFLEQLHITHNSDVFMGMHGAGLTHMLFQPDWGTVFEIYNCEDSECYKDLARLRGVKYLTWVRKEKLTQEDEGHHPTLGAHAKFTNYAFDVKEFIRMVDQGIEHVVNHPAYKKAWQGKWSQTVKHNFDEL